MNQPTCKDRVRNNLSGRISDLSQLWEAYRKGEEYVEGLGNFNEYGLCFDYVAPNTFSDQKRGYFRYQISTGGPGDEFRFYCDENRNPTHIEYWFLDWFDGASITLEGKEYDLLLEIWDFFKEIGSVDIAYKEAVTDVERESQYRRNITGTFDD